MIVISLIGEQPIPNLLPLLHFRPTGAVLVYTERTAPAAKRLTGLLPSGCEAIALPVQPYEIQESCQALCDLIKDNSWPAEELLFNLTGGTKAMALAAYLAAHRHLAPFVYLQSEGKQTRLFRYEFGSDSEPHLTQDHLLPGLIAICDYLRAHLDEYQVTGFCEGEEGLPFEKAVCAALDPPITDKVVAGVKSLGAIDIDLVVRCGNQVGIIEAKTGKKGRSKAPIDQLNTAGGREYLGTYTAKFLVVDQAWDKRQSSLKALAEARQIKVIELPSFSQTGALSAEDTAKLQQTVCKALGKRIA